jgi:hypothetical protein
VGGGPVQGAEHVLPGGGQVVGGAGFDVGDPQREHVRCHHRLDVAALPAGLAGVPGVDLLAFCASGLLVDGETRSPAEPVYAGQRAFLMLYPIVELRGLEPLTLTLPATSTQVVNLDH